MPSSVQACDSVQIIAGDADSSLLLTSSSVVCYIQSSVQVSMLDICLGGQLTAHWCGAAYTHPNPYALARTTLDMLIQCRLPLPRKSYKRSQLHQV